MPTKGPQRSFPCCPSPTYRCDGFAPPLANSPLRFKRNKAIALRANLFDDVAGVEITGDDLSFTEPPTVQAWRFPLDPDDPDDAVDVSADALPVGQADDGNQFYYVNTGYWQFILDGRSWSAPGRYEVLMDSGEHMDYMIDPTCMVEFVVE